MYLNENILIERNKILIGEVVKDAQYTKGSFIANLMCEPSEIDDMPLYDYGQCCYPTTQILRGMIFYLDSNNKTIDVGNPDVKYNYPVANITDNLFKELEQSSNISIRDFYMANGLLVNLGFDEFLNLDDIKKLKQIISKQREIVKLAKVCGYRKINTLFTSALDYEQEIKLGRGYYKFTGSEICPSDRCTYKDKSIYENPIKNFNIFEVLASNVRYGYNESKEEKILKLSNN